MKNIMFIAPPAAGKGTQAEFLVEKYGIPHISVGDILRAIANEESEIGFYVRETINSGKLIDNEITYKLIKERLSQDDCKNGFVIDGFPRNLEQSLRYDQILEELGQKVGLLFYIEMDKKRLEERVLRRRICGTCKSVYNLDSIMETRDASICEKCEGKLYQRNDDNLEAFKTRYEMYLKQTEPVVRHYESMGVLHKIDGEGTVKDIFQRIDSIVKDNITGSDE